MSVLIAGSPLRPLVAGLVAGLVLAMVEMALAQIVLGLSVWSQPRMMASIILGGDALQRTDFDAMVVPLGFLVHFTLAVIYAYVAAMVIAQVPPGFGVLTGAAIGLAIYVINFHGFAQLWDHIAQFRSWVTVTDHVIFGMVLGWILKAPVPETKALGRA